MTCDSTIMIEPYFHMKLLVVKDNILDLRLTDLARYALHSTLLLGMMRLLKLMPLVIECFKVIVLCLMYPVPIGQ